jgi:hypothetical protein
VAEARHITDLSLEELAEVERVEAELDTFVEKRARQAKDAESTAALWLKTEREHREKKRSANGWGWIRHYEGLARAHRALAHETRIRIQKVTEMAAAGYEPRVIASAAKLPQQLVEAMLALSPQQTTGGEGDG